MGGGVARHLLSEGWNVVVYDPVPSAVAPLVGAGATQSATPNELGGRCQIVLISVPGPPEQAEAIVGESGLLSGLAAGSVIVDLTTSSIAAVQRLAAAAQNAGIYYLDAPVSGGEGGAERGDLTVMVSGPAAGIALARPVLDAISAKLFELGENPGTGTLIKLINNAIVLAAGLPFQEGLVLAAKAGIEPSVLMDVLRVSSANPYLLLADSALHRNFDNATFRVLLAEKDLALFVDSADELGVSVPVNGAALDTYRRARDLGLGHKQFTATLEAIEDAAGVVVPRVE
jgi:3-hydroxyisobutyrate dehydrogenase-like beta-hydroxyacid dehydrogenase